MMNHFEISDFCSARGAICDYEGAIELQNYLIKEVGFILSLVDFYLASQ